MIRGATEYSITSRSANRGDEVIECEKARVQRSVLLGLIGCILGRADRKVGPVTVPTR